MKVICYWFIAMAVSASAIAGELIGHPEIVDGDTIVIDGQRVRLLGMDTPEYDQEYGRDATEALTTLVAGRELRCEWSERDQYDRLLAWCYPPTNSGNWSKVSVNKAMVRQGYAAAYLQYGDQLAGTMHTAMKDCRGMWKSAGLPWCWRREQ